jgi:predicted enzyme related to lactoylglutathione lyase
LSLASSILLSDQRARRWRIQKQQEEDAMLNGLQFVLAHVSDLATARAFYTETLGLTVAAEQPGFVQFAQPGGKGAWFALSESADARPFSDPELWWYVDDADAVSAQLAQRGVAIVEQPHDMPFGRVFTIHDPAGAAIYMLEPR